MRNDYSIEPNGNVYSTKIRPHMYDVFYFGAYLFTTDNPLPDIRAHATITGGFFVESEIDKRVDEIGASNRKKVLNKAPLSESLFASAN